jgi:hypothetical protein
MANGITCISLLQDGEEPQVIGTTPKMICHVFESEEVRKSFPYEQFGLFEFTGLDPDPYVFRPPEFVSHKSGSGSGSFVFS